MLDAMIEISPRDEIEGMMAGAKDRHSYAAMKMLSSGDDRNRSSARIAQSARGVCRPRRNGIGSGQDHSSGSEIEAG
jgi:hypothetical protein